MWCGLDNLALREISADDYAVHVLPLTHHLWGGARAFDEYLAHLLQIARSPYGRKHFRTHGLYHGADLVASFKQYERTIRIGKRKARATGIGAVFTNEHARGRGYGTAMLALAMDTFRQNGDHLAYLFSDIHPAFYNAIGFLECPSRAFSLRADGLQTARLPIYTLETNDWPSVQRCFAQSEARRPLAFERTAAVWNWIRLRLEHGSEHPPDAQPTQRVIRRGADVIAYVLGVRDVRRDAFAIDECAYVDEGREMVGPLLRAAAGDLQRVSGWLPPDGVRELLPRGSVRRRKDAILMVAPLTPLGHEIAAEMRRPGPFDRIWSADHI